MIPRFGSLKEILSSRGLPTLPGSDNLYLDACNFSTPRKMIEFNIYWEDKAIEGYTLHMDRALWLEDVKTAALFSHIRSEEQEHFEELLERYEELTKGKG